MLARRRSGAPRAVSAPSRALWALIVVTSIFALPSRTLADAPPVAVAPLAAGTLAATDGQKLWGSRDNGATWTVIGPMPGAGDSQSVWLLGTGDTVLSSDGKSLYRSVDEGATWQVEPSEGKLANDL